MSIIQGIMLGAILTVFLGLGGTAFFEAHTITDLRTQLDALHVKNDVCLADNKNWKSVTDVQNKLISKMSADAAARDAAAAKAVAAARAGRDKAVSNAAAILAQKVSANDCTGAKQVLQSYLKRPK